MTHLEIVKKGLEEISFPLVTEQGLFTCPADLTFNDPKWKWVETHKAIINELGDPIYWQRL